MHEQGLMKTLLKQVDMICRENGSQTACEIRVEVGPLSGVEPALLHSAFELMASSTSARGAEFCIDEIPLMARCIQCQSEFEVSGFKFRCPDCGGGIRVVSGDGLTLLSVTLVAPLSNSQCETNHP